jgi:hypothetical protein
MPAARRYRDSGEVRWPSPTKEVYEEGRAVFDVHAAKGFLSTHRVLVQYVPAAALAEWTQTTASGRRNPGAGRIEASRVARADPGIPIILAVTPRRVYLIDGHHRLERGRRLGYSEFPVIVLREPALVRSLMRGSTDRLTLWWHWGTSDSHRKARTPYRSGRDSTPGSVGP